LGFAVVIVASS